MDFQLIGDAKFKSEHIFTKAFANYLKRIINNKKNPICGLDNSIVNEIVESAKEDKDFGFDDMFPMLSELCDMAEKPVVLIIDEVDSATNNKVFLDFLAQLRGYYLGRMDNNTSTFQSVILAGVYDVKNIKMKIRPESEHKVNSPWNIATDFLVDMSFSKDDIKGMLEQYDAALANKYRFTEGHRLNMTKVLRGFVKAFEEISQGKDEKFLEEEGRKYFMLYLKPIINGTGHSYVEARTRYFGSTDLVVDYLGEQFVIERKIWNGPKYHANGEAQTIEYLDYYRLKKGYMVTFYFNKHKETGVKEVQYGDYTLIEAVV